MNLTVIKAAKLISTVGGAALVTWQLAQQIDTALIRHLDEKFATKEDINRIEKKVDALLAHSHK